MGHTKKLIMRLSEILTASSLLLTPILLMDL